MQSLGGWGYGYAHDPQQYGGQEWNAYAGGHHPAGGYAHNYAFQAGQAYTYGAVQAYDQHANIQYQHAPTLEVTQVTPRITQSDEGRGVGGRARVQTVTQASSAPVGDSAFAELMAATYTKTSKPSSGTAGASNQATRAQANVKQQGKAADKLPGLGTRRAVRNTLFTCKRCAAQFLTVAELREHMKSAHNEEKLYTCPFDGCGAIFNHSHAFTEHQRIHTGEKPHKCPFDGCDKQFAFAKSLLQHKRTHTGERPYKCSYVGCTASFKQSGSLHYHIRTHTGDKPFKCTFPGCNEAFGYRKAREKHVKAHTDGTLGASGGNEEGGDGAVVAVKAAAKPKMRKSVVKKVVKKTGKTSAKETSGELPAAVEVEAAVVEAAKKGKATKTSSKGAAVVGKVTAAAAKTAKPFACTHEGCTKAYASANFLNIHMRSHSKRPYSLTGTTKTTTVPQLKPHIAEALTQGTTSIIPLLSTREKPPQAPKMWHCEYPGCTVSCTRVDTLKAHMRVHTGEKPYGCKICGAAFTHSKSLRVHIRTHTGEKPYKCEHEGCGAAFAQYGQLQHHKYTHTGVKPLQCPYEGCDKTFGSTSHLRYHIRTHTGERPFKCSVCALTFITQQAARVHEQNQHGNGEGKGVAKSPRKKAGGEKRKAGVAAGAAGGEKAGAKKRPRVTAGGGDTMSAGAGAVGNNNTNENEVSSDASRQAAAAGGRKPAPTYFPPSSGAGGLVALEPVRQSASGRAESALNGGGPNRRPFSDLSGGVGGTMGDVDDILAPLPPLQLGASGLGAAAGSGGGGMNMRAGRYAAGGKK